MYQMLYTCINYIVFLMSVRGDTFKSNHGLTLDEEIKITQQRYKDVKQALHNLLTYFDDPVKYQQRLPKLIGAPNRLLGQLDQIFGRLMELLTEHYNRSDQHKIPLATHKGMMETQQIDHERAIAEMNQRLGLFNSLDRVTGGTVSHLNNFHNSLAHWDWGKQRSH